MVIGEHIFNTALFTIFLNLPIIYPIHIIQCLLFEIKFQCCMSIIISSEQGQNHVQSYLFLLMLLEKYFAAHSNLIQT